MGEAQEDQLQMKNSAGPSAISTGKYIIGFVCTVAASAGTGLEFSLKQLVFRKVLKRKTFAEVMDVIIYPSLVASLATMVGLFASGEWKGLKREMEEFELGKVLYLMTLIWTAILWQVLTLGSTGLTSEASSLFANSVMAMVLAIWGFTSYAYQQYLDDMNSKPKDKNSDGVPNA